MPGAMEAAPGTTFRDELAIMIGTFRPLQLGEAALERADEACTTSAARALGTAKPRPPLAGTEQGRMARPPAAPPPRGNDKGA